MAGTGVILRCDLIAADIGESRAIADGLCRLGLSSRTVNVLTYGAGLNAPADLFARDWSAPHGLRSRLATTPGCGPRMLAELDARRAEILRGYWSSCGAPNVKEGAG